VLKPNQKKIAKQEQEQFLKEAQSWERTRQFMEQKSTRVAWRLCGVSWAITAIAVTGLALVGPMKEVVPFVIQTDKTTGVVDVVNEMANAKSSYDEAIDKFFLQNYVRYREGYSNELAKEFYNRVGLLSGPNEQTRYFAWFNPHNRNSPLNVYKDFATVNVTMKSVSFINKDKDSGNTVALVRYIKEIERGGDKSVSNWVATITYKYVRLPMKEKDREVNPLGFQVMDYRNDPEGAAFEVPAVRALPKTPTAKPSADIFPPSASQAAAPVAEGSN
jgi:type IV secretion system protein VirB8